VITLEKQERKKYKMEQELQELKLYISWPGRAWSECLRNMCFFKLCLKPHLKEQCGQACGLWPVWVFMWSCRWLWPWHWIRQVGHCSLFSWLLATGDIKFMKVNWKGKLKSLKYFN